MSAVKEEKAIKRITKKSVFLLWSEEDAVMNNSLPRFYSRISTINGLVKKKHLQWKRWSIRCCLPLDISNFF